MYDIVLIIIGAVGIFVTIVGGLLFGPIGLLIGIAILVVAGVSRSNKKSIFAAKAPAEPTRISCPYCSEAILATASVCRFCSRELPAGWAKKRSTVA